MTWHTETHLNRSPARTALLRVAGRIRLNGIFDLRQPTFLQERHLDLLKLSTVRLALYGTEKMVVVRAFLPVERTVLDCPFEPARQCLANIDVLDPVVGGVVLDVERYRRVGDHLAFEPADTLVREDIVGAVTQ